MGRKITLALDLGSYELKGIVFEIVEFKNSIHVLAAKKERSLGLENGSIKNPEALKKQIANVVDPLISEVGDYIDEVYLSIPPVNTFCNNIVKSMNVADSKGSSLITNNDVSQLTEKIIEDIKRGTSEHESTLIDFIINEYRVYPTSNKVHSEIVDNPVSLAAFSFSMEMFYVLAKTYILTTLQSIFEELEILFDRCTVPYIPGALKAVPYTARKNGALYLDFGASFTDCVIFKNNSIVHYFSLPFGGYHVTSDIIKAFGKSVDDKNFEKAEKIKKKYGNLIIDAEDSQKNVYIEQDLLSDNFLTLEQLKLVMQERVREIFTLVKDEIDKNHSLSARGITFSQVVLAGGSAKLEGVGDIAGEVFGVPSLVATPFIDSGIDFEEINTPEFVPVYGLAEYFAGDIRKPVLSSGFLNRLVGKIKTIFFKKKGGE